MSEINPHKITKLKKKIDKFLNSKKTVTGDFTHISMGGLTKAGKFIINDKKDVKKLYSLLADALDYNLNYSIAEKQKDYGPVKIDIDLESTTKGNNDNKEEL